MDFHGGTFRAARALLALGQADVSVLAGVERNIVVRMEAGKYQRVLRPELIKLKRFYEKKGIEFIDATTLHGPGIRWALGLTGDLVQRGQLRAGRALVGIVQAKLAARAKVSQSLISRFENGKTQSLPVEDFVEIVSVLKEEGVELTDDPVRGTASVQLATRGAANTRDRQ
jgi:Predicted transcriptional regulator with C-terminal CBS domains